MKALTVRACAKLNLTLDVADRRADGYHDMTMIMQSVDLCDALSLSLEGEEIVVECGALSGQDNLAYRAAALYRGAAGCAEGIRVVIDKRIPLRGGMAGGSADAAAVLAALDRLIGTVPWEKLRQIALMLGADVPFALVGGTALATGVGERLTPLPPLPNCVFLLASVGEKPSTAEMFARLDALPDRRRPDTAAVLAALQAGDLPRAARGFVNAFFPLWESETTRALRQAMTDAGALSVSLTGAGPTLFATFADEEVALRCQAALSAPTLLCRPTQKSILFE